MRFALGCCALLVATLPAAADYERRIVGDWMISANEDRFGDGGTFTALTSDGSNILAVRCIQKNLSLAMMEVGGDPKPVTKGDLFAYKFRVDKQPIVEVYGEAINERLIQIATEKSLVKAMRAGQETAVRSETTSGVTRVSIFRMKGAPKAFADLSKECPLD